MTTIAPDEAGLQGLFLSHRKFVGLGEALLGGLGTLELGIVQLEVVQLEVVQLEVVGVAGYLLVDRLTLFGGGQDDPVAVVGDWLCRWL